MLYATTVHHQEELLEILDLQQQNLRDTLPPDEEKEQGFVTVAHDLVSLQQLHLEAPSIIVKDDDLLVGYALVMSIECRQLIPELISMFARFDNVQYQTKPLSSYHFYVMGQVCVRKSYRGKGVFDMLYQKHRITMHPAYDFVVTEIATRNGRSLRAHERIGFQTIEIYRDDLDEWAVVLWDWRL